MAAQHLLELRGTGRRPLPTDRSSLAYSLHPKRPRLGDSALCREHSTRIARVHVALRMQRASEIAAVHVAAFRKDTKMNIHAVITKDEVNFRPARRVNQALTAS